MIYIKVHGGLRKFGGTANRKELHNPVTNTKSDTTFSGLFSKRCRFSSDSGIDVWPHHPRVQPLHSRVNMSTTLRETLYRPVSLGGDWKKNPALVTDFIKSCSFSQAMAFSATTITENQSWRDWTRKRFSFLVLFYKKKILIRNSIMSNILRVV